MSVRRSKLGQQPSGQVCGSGLRSSVPSARGTNKRNLFCHNMARGLFSSPSVLCNARSLGPGVRGAVNQTRARSHSEIRKRGRNWQPTDGRLQRQSSGSNGDRKQDEPRPELLVSSDPCSLTLRF